MLRVLTKSDVKDALMIEEAVHANPWTEETFYSCFEAGCAGWVSQDDNQIIGFIIVAVRVPECHILNLCVAPDYQHQGWGEKLLKQALEDAKQKKAKIAYLEVRRSNAPAIALYKKMKFYRIGERKDYYPSEIGAEDAIVFAKDISDR